MEWLKGLHTTGVSATQEVEQVICNSNRKLFIASSEPLLTSPTSNLQSESGHGGDHESSFVFTDSRIRRIGRLCDTINKRSDNDVTASDERTPAPHTPGASYRRSARNVGCDKRVDRKG
jgi:hypothetical protein